jgi:hypothetical protein
MIKPLYLGQMACGVSTSCSAHGLALKACGPDGGGGQMEYKKSLEIQIKEREGKDSFPMSGE